MQSKRPDLFIVVGPNGSGKSSAIYLTNIDGSLIFVNPDDVARNEFAHIKDKEERNRLAWESCNNQRDALLLKKVSFGFETVGSHKSKVELLIKAKKLGYNVILLFVATEDPEINIRRIKHRVSQGGHDVPEVFRGTKLQIIGPGASISRNGIVYYPFQSEDEAMEWIDAVSSDWWNDATI
ncbi:hypothetical protein FACS1894104_0230 [Actinomycetota bacterium]|nr:hypothetical protein FACS1894104_0230 [Actinomycetota bacterium]